MDSILNTTKKLLGIQEDYTHFDPEIILNINAALMSLNQLGIGPAEGFIVMDDGSTWKDLIGDRTDLAGIQMYVYLKTRLGFDPPQMGYLIDSINKQIEEIGWRLNLQVETIPSTSEKYPDDDAGESIIKFWYSFKISDWSPVLGKYKLRIPVSVHGMFDKPTINEILNSQSEMVLCSWRLYPNGDLEVTSDNPFDGQLLII